MSLRPCWGRESVPSPAKRGRVRVGAHSSDALFYFFFATSVSSFNVNV